MRNDEKCCKCGMDIFEIKKVAIPTKKAVGAKIAIDTFYLKICNGFSKPCLYSRQIKLKRFLYQRMMTEQAVDSLGYVFVG